jgi:2,3-bisphosphoglycerate-independent phosphoglycerate mutase
VDERIWIVDHGLIKGLVQQETTKIVLLVMDGLGGLPREKGGPTELEAADTPNLDRLAAEGICGLSVPVRSGVTPGSGPGHLSLFGYDPTECIVGRGVLSALGIGFDLQKGDVAARGNFCTLDEDGLVIDRRANRISGSESAPLVEKLDEIEIPGVEVFVRLVKDYRLLLVLRGEGLSGEIDDTDPQETGVPPEEPRALVPEAEETAELVAQFLAAARDVLADHHPANGILMRGFSTRPDWPLIQDLFGLKAAAIASYPMYRGVSRLLGMDILGDPHDFEEELDLLEKHWGTYDFFFVHIKPIDAAGEDGDFDRKVRTIEEADAHIPRLMELGPDVLVVTGDHSTPSVLRAHSWHPVPALVWSAWCRSDGVTSFGERPCMLGGLGPRLPATELMPIALANALRLEKFGA